MSFNSEYQELRKKRKKNEQENKASNDIAPLNFSMSDIAPAYEYNAKKEDIAPLKTYSGEDGAAPLKTITGSASTMTQDFYDKWGKLTEAEDFVRFSEQGAAIKNPTVKDAEGWANIFGWRLGAEDIGNIVTYSRDNVNEIILGEFNGGSHVDMLGNTLYTEMTDDEVKIYNYLLAKEGKKKAQEYLDDIEETLNARKGGKVAEGISKQDNAINKAVAYGAMSFSAGVEQFATGMKQRFTEEELPTSSTAVANQILLEGLDGFSEKAYMAGNVVGNMLPSIAVSYFTKGAGIPVKAAQAIGATTVGLSSAGNAYKQALSEGYSQEQARSYSNLVGAAEGGLQYALGGIGSLGGASTSKIMGKIATIDNALVRISAKYAVDGLAEIGEEELQLYLEPAFRSIIFGEEYDAPTIEEMLDTAVVTAMSTVALNAGGDIASGNVSTVEGLTPNEAKVVEKEVENRIAEREAKGEKVTNKVKNEIYKEVMEDLTKGYISTDTIESVLDGDSYESYKNLRDKESSLNEKVDSLSQEIETLLDKENPTIRDNERLAEARKELETAKSDLEKIGGHINEHITYTRHNMNEALKSERKGKGSYLAESYNEIGRLNERYVADFSKYEGTKHEDAARKTIENAMNRGANNTNRVHDIVELGASLSADTGIVFDWAGNEDIKKDFIKQQKSEIEKLEKMTELSEEDATKLSELKEMLRKVEAGEVTVNGNITDNGIVINLDSKKALQSIVGHEIAHSLENTEAYKKLKEALFAYAKEKGVDIEAAIEAKTKTYKGVNKSKPEQELLADLVGDYIFNDYNFVFDLAMNDKTTFQKLWDDVKYLYKIATAGSKEARDLARAKHNFERAYRESLEATKKTDGVMKNDIVVLEGGKAYVEASRKVINGTTRAEQRKEISNFFNELLEENDSLDITTIEGDVLTITKAETAHKARDDHQMVDGQRVDMTDDEFAVKLRVEAHIDEVAEVSTKTKPTTADSKGHSFAKDGFTYRRAYFKDFDGQYYEITLSIGHNGTVATVYNVGKIKESALPTAKIIAGVGSKPLGRTPSGRIIPQTDTDVKRDYSLSLSDSDGNQPTADPDIRFSLSEAVEETKDLIAVHNLKSNELLKSFELGGLPMPSIAVIKAEAGHDQYGEISLILPKEAIDPQASKDNKVYGGDAWTPTYPRMQYKANEAVAKRLRDKYYAMENEYGYDKVRSLYNYVYELENALNRSGGEAALKEELYDDTRMMQVYLLDSGKGEVPTVKKEIRTELTDNEVSMYEFFAQTLGSEVIEGVNQTGLGSPIEQRKAYWENHGEAIKEAYGEFLSKEFGFSEEDVQNVLSNMKTADFLKVVRDAKRYQTNGRVTIKTEDDFNATQEAIREAAGEGYRAWVDDLFGGSEEKSGIRNNVDYYTRNGTPRSWEALHWENTLENVVKAMKQQDNTGSEALFGVHKFFAASSKNYKNIAEIKADSDRLHKISDGDYKAAKEAYESRFVDIANRIMDKTESNRFIAQENAMECIVDAVRNSRTQEGIYKELSQYTQLNVTEQDVADIVSLVNDISNMPTGYFEAKPMRAVGFDEVGVFVIPRNADVKLKQELLSRGYAIAEYDPDVEGDRQKVVNSFEEYKFSLSDAGEQLAPFGRRGTYGKDFLVRGDNVLAPVPEAAPEAVPVATTTAKAPVSENVAPEGFAPIPESEANAMQSENIATLNDSDAPSEIAPYYGEDNTESATPSNPFEQRDYTKVGNPKEQAYTAENPEAKPFFQEAAQGMLGDLQNSLKGERWYNDALYYESGGGQGFSGTRRDTTADIADLLDGQYHYTYQQIEEALNAIINDEKLNACAKRIEFALNDRLLNGYTDINGMEIPPNQDYINLLSQMRMAEDIHREGVESIEHITEAPYEPMEAQPTEDIAPLPDMSNAGRNVAQGRRSMFSEKQEKRRVARVLTEEPQAPKKKARAWSLFRSNFLDKQSVFEDLALKTKNRELMGKANHMLSSESRAQWFIGHGKGNVKALTDIRKEVESSGKLEQFYDYIYHVHNIDRMSLETDENRAKRMAVRQQFQGLSDKQIQSVALTWITKDTTAEEEARIRAAREYVELSKNKDKPVFDYSVTADVSRETVKKYEAANPEFKAWAQDVYDYNKHLRKLLVDGNVISQETADLWEKIYPHFVPIRRKGHDGAAVNVPLDSRKTGVNAPIKRATGGNDDILPLFDTMALRTEQTFKAVAKNQFGLELLHTLDSAIEADEANGSAASVDDILDSMETQDELLQKGKDGMNPTFTVFENGKRVTFEITEDMYDALKPTSEALSLTIKPLNVASNIRRGLITEYNPVFLATNAIKDAQDVLINSQHPVKTYANLPKAYWELAKKGKWYTEYMAAGGEQNTFFDGESKTFKKEDEGFKKLIGIPLRAISAANNFLERAPRLAEYIASRESGASIETAMLDAARVTTNFAAGGDVTKLLNRNGFTFLNASVQGFNQQVRNVREAKANGFKGWAQLAAKTMIAGIPALLLNGLLWDDDEDYEELSDYVKDNYYIVAKYGDGQFVRIPKGRAVAVIQDAFEQIKNVATGEEADWKNLWELAKTNVAPTNLADNNIIAPIKQVLKNKTWYGEDLVPTRLQDLPAAEQFDESTDSISKWLGEKTNTSPIKWNYLLDQYSGAVGDVFLPMMTPEAESGDNSLAGNLLAPWKDKFSTDSVMNNQNVSDFYDTVDELAKNANSSRATDEDILKSKYMNSVNSELSALYKEKREIQNSDLADDEKYAAVREIQEEIVKTAKNGLRDYKHVAIDEGYARVGDRYYRMDDEGKWVKLTDKQIAQQQDVTAELGIDPSAYWQDKSEYDFAYEYPEKYAVARSVGGYDAYKAYSSELYDIKADKDEYGKSIIGSRKEKVIDWINEQEDLDYGEAIILFKSEYPADDTYNMDIIDYLNGRDDISYEDMETILKELGFNVDKKGNITWD